MSAMDPVDIRGASKEVLDVMIMFAVISGALAAGFSIYWAVRRRRRKQDMKRRRTERSAGSAPRTRKEPGGRKRYR